MKFLTIILLAIALTACSGKPSDGDIKAQYIENAMKGKDPSLSGIENFEKVNGFQKDERTYIADVKFDVIFKKSFDEVAKETKRDFGGMLKLTALEETMGRFKAGHKISYEDKLTFTKTEKGWILNR